MTATIVDGKALARAWLDDIAAQVRVLSAPLHLAAVCAGGDEGLKKFVALKQKAAQSMGITFSSYFFDANDEVGARATLQYLAADDDVHGIFVELPLPNAWDTDALLAFIPSGKDVDALTRDARVPAPAVRALEYLLDEYGIDTHGLDAAVVGSGKLVGAPIAAWLTSHGAAVDVVDVDTGNPSSVTSRVDLVVCGAGVPKLVDGRWIKEGTTVIDFGYSDGVGDVDGASVIKKAGLLTPVPGGMGPLVIVAVLENLLMLSTS